MAGCALLVVGGPLLVVVPQVLPQHVVHELGEPAMTQVYSTGTNNKLM